MGKTKRIFLSIANLAPFEVNATSSEDEATWISARDKVNDLWVKWTRDFPKKSHEEILAMIALRFAQVYKAQEREAKELDSLLDNFENEIDSMIIGANDQQTEGEEPQQREFFNNSDF
ncbi:MAG: cell division protein ZapA [Muribaculaceae bacterium]|nr:cell division protein ZapA [Muribaculaceae bacterium]